MTASSRLTSLDVFRGLTMASMVIVNNPGDWGNVYAPLLHAPWHGLTPTDLIFPFFLFIVGVSIPLARRSSASSWTIVRRALLIFALGMLLALYPRFDFATVRIPGVLQRIAVCYLVVALGHYYSLGVANAEAARRSLVSAAILLVSYWSLIHHDLTPDGNIGAVVDRAVFGEHLWRQSRTWDPEGLVSTVPAIATTLSGLAAGYVLTSDWAFTKRIRAIIIGSLASLALGYLWSLWFPLNKSLWTSSYVLVTSGYAGLLLGLLEVVGQRLEVEKTLVVGQNGVVGRLSQPFVVLGRNALLLFVVSGFLAKTLALIRVDNGQGGTMAVSRWIYSSWFVPLASPKNASLLYALANLAVLFALLWWLHRRRRYFRV